MAKLNGSRIQFMCRLSYANLSEPRAFNGQKEKYSVSCIIPKSDKGTIAKITRAVNEAKEEGKTVLWGNTIPGKLLTPLHDGDTDKAGDEAYANAVYLNASNQKKPGLYGRDAKPIADESMLYSGCYAKVDVVFKAYDNASKGVTSYLQGVQFVRDGELLGGGAYCSFDAIEEDESGAFEDDLPDFMK